MCHGDGIGHVFLCLIGRIAEHHSLVTGSDRLDILVRHPVFFRLQSLVNTQSDIRRLLVNGRQNAAGIGVKSKFPSRITDLTHGITHDLRDIYIGVCRDLSHDHHHTGRTTGLACHAAHRILLHEGVKDRV